ncbi:hypothetical protein NEOLEDRAFT_412785 [Neolentinus lepideus HHB14362 ss-1]|uniref:GET complex, subunit GET2 n=1 Tax=Neolentinus lepideus HHB14362 ss-1 TaxID=1314782 RepID=A0A165S623_9AGAM|nr:hypothetical protein NEOLEDRAFT_412785 [Neolentinus lepideus HHB14362 ss-1]
MSTAAARAEARRKALRERGTDRLAKLSTSARGEDSPVYKTSEKTTPKPISNLKNFVGEETHLPPPPSSRPAPSTSAFNSSTTADPSAWSQEQQMEFMRALMGATINPPSNDQSQAPPTITSAGQSAGPQQDDPLAALMSSLSQMNPQSSAGRDTDVVPNPLANLGTAFPPPQVATPPKPLSTLRKLMPLIHILATWCLLAYYVLIAEPRASPAQPTNGWQKWADLAWRKSAAVQAVPFFWAFTTLQLVLHSYRVFSGFDTVQPPMLLAMALPQLPKPLPALIMNGMKYMQLGGALLDDLAALIFVLGVIVWVATWVSS